MLNILSLIIHDERRCQNFFCADRVTVSMKITGIILLIIGVISIIIQNTFYGYVDADGMLHDSIFLPVGVIATILGGIFLSAWGAIKLFKREV